MQNLLCAGIRRYTRNIVFWLAIIATVVAAVLCSVNTRQLYFDDFYCMVVFISLAVMISWLVGRENDEGIFKKQDRCRLYQRTDIYFRTDPRCRHMLNNVFALCGHIYCI